MSSPHQPSRHSSSSKRKSSSKSKSKKDDWSDITDPEERRRVQNRIAQRKFRDKAKENKERQERDEENRIHAHHSYIIPDPRDMVADDNLSGLPWGSLSLRHVVSKGRAKESESRQDSSKSQEEQSHYDVPQPLYDDRDGYYEESQYYEDGEQGYYDYGSGGSNSVHGDFSDSPRYYSNSII